MTVTIRRRVFLLALLVCLLSAPAAFAQFPTCNGCVHSVGPTWDYWSCQHIDYQMCKSYNLDCSLRCFTDTSHHSCFIDVAYPCYAN